MQPTSVSSDRPKGNPWRRYGPIAAIGAVVAVIAVVAIVSGGGGGDDEDVTADAATTVAASAPTTVAGTTAGTQGATPTTAAAPQRPEGAISFSQAEELGLDVTFPAGCDLETGRVAMPYYFAPECYADQPDNGGATAPGVTADAVTVVVYVAPDLDPVLDFITAAINNDDTAADVEATYRGYTEMFQSLYQTYGRTVELKFLHGSGGSENEVAARADAVRAVEELGAFAVWGGPALAPAWTEEIKARGVVCLGCPLVADPTPTAFPVVASLAQTRLHLAEYVVKKLKDRPAEHAGQAELTTQPRVFAQLFLETVGGPQAAEAADFRARLEEGGVTLAEQIAYSLEPATIQEQATTAISRLKAAGVTTVIVNGDPIAPKTFTEEATKQNYFPEWVYGGSALIDTNAFGRTYDQQQWEHAFGISSLPARLGPEAEAQADLYRWFHGEAPAADDSEYVLLPQPALFFLALQAAGPNLTAETFRDGLFTFGPGERTVTQAGVTFGDHGLWPETDYYGIDDFTEIWWDPDATGEDELNREGQGMMRFVDGGRRYRLGEWTDGQKAFVEEGAVTVYDEVPASELPTQYPAP